MSVSRIEYLERFLDDVEFVISGKRNAISEDRWLVVNYDPMFYSAVSKHLKNTDERVRADVITLLGRVRERAAIDDVRVMRSSDKESVRTACLGYLDLMNESDNLMPDLFYILEHSNGKDFERAAMRIGNHGSSEDVPRLRKTYGQVSGDMRAVVQRTLVTIIDRDPELAKKKELLLSVPVFPDENKFSTFLDNSITYLDIRYRDSVAGKDIISERTYSNVRGAIKTMRVRMFNEYDNLKHYGRSCTDMYDELIRLMEWASADLSEKTVDKDDRIRKDVFCPRCGNEMRMHDGVRRCIDCFMRK
jgi:HEAT repeat protein